jgi:hypothetical protein
MTMLATSLSDDDIPLADQKNNGLTGGGAPHIGRLLKPGYLMITLDHQMPRIISDVWEG